MPEYEWANAPGPLPEILWEHAARPLWAQAVPEREGVLLLEKERWLYREAATGQTVWQQTSTALPDAVAQDSRGIVLASGRDLRELDPATGALRWRQRLGAPVTTPALDPGSVYAASQGPVFALDRSDGRVRWQAPGSAEALLHPLPEDGLLAVADPETESVIVWETGTGARRWEFSAGGEPLAVGPLCRGLLWISGHARGVVAVDASTGEVRWRLESERSFETPGAVLGERLFFSDGSLYAVDASSREVCWRRTLEEEEEEEGIFAVRVERGTLLAETWRGRLLSLSPADGSLLWERRPGQVQGTASAGQRLYLRVSLLEPEGLWAVLALSRSTGEPLWELRSPRMIPDITVAGGVLVVELKNRVLAFRLE